MKKVKPARKAEDWPHPPPHPFGEDRGGRIERWKSIAAFDPKGPIGQIAKLALDAAGAGTGKEIERLSRYALGLHEPTKTNGNTERLREALDEFSRAYDAVHPLVDDDISEESGKAMKAAAVAAGLMEAEIDVIATNAELQEIGAAAQKRLQSMCAEGLDLWLFRRVNGHDPVGDRPEQFLIRNARKGSDDLVRVLDWALRAAEPLTPRQRFSRGRKGS